MIVGGALGEKHALDMNDAAMRLQFEEFAGNVESLPFGVFPLVAKLPARSALKNANGHRPTVRTEQPLLNQAWIGMGAVYGFGGRGESPGHHDVGVAFSFQRQFANRFSPLLIFRGSILARPSSRRS